MKRVFKFFGLVAVGLNIMVNVSAQQKFVPNYGSNEDLCKRNLSLYRTEYDLRNFNDAIIHWRKVWRDCPLGSLILHFMEPQCTSISLTGSLIKT